MTNDSIQAQLRDWATKAIAVFNSLSEAKQTPYYTQSPLDAIAKSIDNLVIGINPGSEGNIASVHTVDSFLSGNKGWWNNRFESGEDATSISKGNKYFGGAHYFICNDMIRHNNGFDDDTKTVWTNFTPFATKSKSTLGNRYYKVSVPIIVKLIEILAPKRIYLLGVDSFNFLEEFNNCVQVERKKILKDNIGGGVLEIGMINGIPAIQLPHPSQNWRFHNFFVPIFVKMWHTLLGESLSFEDLAIKMRKQLTRLEPLEN